MICNYKNFVITDRYYELNFVITVRTEFRNYGIPILCYVGINRAGRFGDIIVIPRYISSAILIPKPFLLNDKTVIDTIGDITVVKMAVRQTATTVANYLSTVESNSESENDDDDGVIEEDIDGNEAGSEVEATDADERDERRAGQGKGEASDGISVSGVTLPELLPKKGTKSLHE